MILSALGYAGAALLYRRWLPDAPTVAVTALMTVISSVAFLGPAAAGSILDRGRCRSILLGS